MTALVIVVIAVAMAALLFTAFVVFRRNRRFVEGTRIAMLCTPPGVRQAQERARTLSLSRERFPELLVFKTLYWENDWDTMLAFIARYEIPILEMPRHTRGKVARWMAAIMACKYAIDLDKRLLLIEDDVLLPRDFNFNEAVSPLRKYDFVKLSKWGEAYLFNRSGGEKFIRKIYELGINTHSDEFIKANVSEFTLRMIRAEYVQAQKNEGNIRDTPDAEVCRKVNLASIGSGNFSKLVNTPIFTDESMNPCDFPRLLQDHLDTLANKQQYPETAGS